MGRTISNTQERKRALARRMLIALCASGVLALFALGGTASGYPISGGLNVSDTSVKPGGTVQVSGDGFTPGTPIDIEIFSAPTLLKTVDADGAGSFSTSVTIPTSISPGSHTLSATGGAPSGDTLTLSAEITVEGEGGGGSSSSSGPLAFTGASIGAMAGVALAGIAVGTLFVIATRRRRQAT